MLYFVADRCDGTMCMFNFNYSSIKNKYDVMLNSQIRTVTTSLEEMNRNERVLLKKRTQLLLDLLSEDCLENRENLFIVDIFSFLRW